MQIVKIKKYHPDVPNPQQATELAGGYDVIAHEIIQESSSFVICKLGFALQIPENMVLVLVPRSSLTKTHWVLQNSPGQGDPDYTGEYQFRFRCIPTGVVDSNVKTSKFLEYEPFPYKTGDRIGQIFLRYKIDMQFEEVEELDKTARGHGGFGHTGKDRLVKS